MDKNKTFTYFNIITFSAKVNSIFSLTETIASLVFHPFYSWLYMKTLHVLPGAVFLTSAAIAVPPSFVLM